MTIHRTVFLAGVGLVLFAGCGRERKLSSESPEALRYYAAGVTAWERFYYAEAESAFERSVQNDSAFAMAWCRIAMVNRALQNTAVAKTAMARALAFSPGVSRREQIFISMWHKRLEFDNVGAAAAVDSLLRLYPDEKEGYLFRGNLFEELDKDYDSALRFYQKAVDADSGYAQAVMSLGYAYSNLGDQPRAVEMMQRYIRLAPDAADPRASLADILLRAGRYDEALEQYQKSLTLKPDYWYSVRQIGNVYVMLGRLKEAEQQFHQSLDLLPATPQQSGAHSVADGVLEIERGNYDRAAGFFRRALAVDSTNGSAAYGLAQACIKLKKFADAREVIGKIGKELERRNLLHSPWMLSYHLVRAQLAREEGDLHAALAACDSALEYSVPLTRAEVYRQIAETRLASREFEDALDACEESLSVNPNATDVLFTLTKVYHAKGDARMTVEIGSRLLALWSGADPDFRDRNELFRILGKKSAG
jgi:tetratricopeptide (TPR) repeat protein